MVFGGFLRGSAPHELGLRSNIFSMWLSRADYERLVTQAAQSEFLTSALKSTEKRAEDAENALAAERQRHDWKDIQLINRVVTKNGGYGLDETKPEPVTPPVPEPTQEDLDVLEFFKTCAAEVGESEQDAIEKWKMHMRGESLLIDDKPEM